VVRVLVDATAVPADRGGVGRYVDGLIAALGAADADLAVVCQRADSERYSRLAPAATIVPGPAAVAHRPARLAWEQTGLPLIAGQVKADVVHSPHYTMPLRVGRPVVVTVHDATFFTSPEVPTAVKGTFFRSATRTALRRASRVIVPSKATRDELIRVLDADPTTIDVAYHGVDTELFHPPSQPERDRVTARLGLHGQPYIAFLGTLEPRKNVPALIRGFARAVAGQRDAPALVLAGQPGWDTQVERALDAVPHRLRVIRAGYLPFGTLAGFLGGAELVAYPSLGEGFGLPVLEAMACGACVLTTRRLSLPEVGGDAVAYCGVGAGDVAAGLAELLADPGRRAELATAAQQRAKEFSWATTAERHREAYAKAWSRHLRTR
jgi:glycosyltransferase involved in cell wall biosynthesis